jgi:hypothetical protein
MVRSGNSFGNFHRVCTQFACMRGPGRHISKAYDSEPADSHQAMLSATSREQWTQCCRCRTARIRPAPNDWPVRTPQMQCQQPLFPRRSLSPTHSGKHVLAVCIKQALGELTFSRMTPKLVVPLCRAHSTSIVISYANRQLERYRPAGHNPGTVNRKRHSSAAWRCRIDLIALASASNE